MLTPAQGTLPVELPVADSPAVRGAVASADIPANATHIRSVEVSPDTRRAMARLHYAAFRLDAVDCFRATIDTVTWEHFDLLFRDIRRPRGADWT